MVVLSGATCDIPTLDAWLGWSHFCYCQWGCYLHFVSIYFIFARCRVGVCACELRYVGVHAHGFVARRIPIDCTTSFEQERYDEERAELSLCKLSEIV